MKDFPLVTHAHARDVLAYRLGQPITVAQFLADVTRLAAALPPGRHVLLSSARSQTGRSRAATA